MRVGLWWYALRSAYGTHLKHATPASHPQPTVYWSATTPTHSYSLARSLSLCLPIISYFTYYLLRTVGCTALLGTVLDTATLRMSEAKPSDVPGEMGLLPRGREAMGGRGIFQGGEECMGGAIHQAHKSITHSLLTYAFI